MSNNGNNNRCRIKGDIREILTDAAQGVRTSFGFTCMLIAAVKDDTVPERIEQETNDTHR